MLKINSPIDIIYYISMVEFCCIIKLAHSVYNLYYLDLTPDEPAPPKPNIQISKDDKGSEVLLAGATVQFLEAPCAAMLVDYSGFGRVFSVLILMNDDSFGEVINIFTDGITLKKMDDFEQPTL